MTDAEYEAKFKDMQKYIPFLQRVIEKLKVNNEQSNENPRKAQLQKMEMLHDLLTNKAKKIKMETLVKCEGVLIKLHAKIEKQTNLLHSEDSILNNVKLKDTNNKPSITNENAKNEEIIDISGPASPPPEVVPINIDQPVVIPTERRCSPILVEKESSFSKHSGPHHHHHHSNSEVISDHNHKKSSDKPNYSDDHSHKSKQNIHDSDLSRRSNKHHHHHVSHADDSGKDVHKAKDYKPIPTHISNNCTNNKKMSKAERNPAAQMVQTVKVVITEPLPDRIKQQHFPTFSKFMPRASICHNNLKTLPQTPERSVDNNEAYSPEELWEEYNDASKKVDTKTTRPTVFSRLGEKVIEKSPTRSTSGRYTPIPDVLKSPPLSASDINNLLLESGADKCLNDISDIGSRRPPKTEDTQKKLDASPSISLEFARKKLAQTAKLYSPKSEAQKPPISTDSGASSPLPKERIALKYKPHPRHERLQSISSTDGSECSIQTKIIDPRIKSRLSPSNPIIPTSPINVNVLPAINFSDPRLKKQNIIAPPTTSQIPLPPGFVNTNPINNYSCKVDPRISKITKIPLPGHQSMHFSGSLTTNQPHVSSEKDNTLPIKSDPRLDRRDKSGVENKFGISQCTGKNKSSNKKLNNEQNILSNTKEEQRINANPPKFDSEEDWDTDSESTKTTTKDKPASNNTTKSLSKVIAREEPITSVNLKKSYLKAPDTKDEYIPRPPNSDTEEDWDSEPEPASSNTKVEVSINMSKLNIPVKKPPQVPALSSPAHMQVSPKAFGNYNINSPLLPTPPQKLLQIPYGHIQHQIVGPNILPSVMPASTACNRFNALLNDKTEREKYFESKKQKPYQPRTYKEFREAKERQLEQEAAMKRAFEEEEAKKRTLEFKATVKANQSINSDKREQKIMESKMEKKISSVGGSAVKSKHSNKEQTNISAESSLDKMYRTQNFSSSFPKSNTSFKIPKKKTEEKTKHGIDDTKAETESAVHKTDSAKDASNATKGNCFMKNFKETEEINCNTKEDEVQINDRQVEKTNQHVTEENCKKDNELEEKLYNKNNNNRNNRDPRCKPKDNEEKEEGKKDSLLKDIIIESSENEVVLKPQQKTALEKFNEIAQTLNPKPQRILRRRNTMVAFESAPLVDKDKLKKANAMLFEDIQEEEKRKQKQAEEEKQNARRIRNLEEIFQKTDDNCTVSTQNIITGKRRTRATINFNETVNAINVFKHISKKDSNSTILSQPTPTTSTPTQTQTNIKNTRSNAKKTDKDVEASSESNQSKETDAESTQNFQDKDSSDIKTASKTKSKAERKTKDDDNNKNKPMKPILKVCIKLPKKRLITNVKQAPSTATTTTISTEDKSESKFKPIQEEEHQNCAVSSTSADTPSEDQPSACASNSSSSSTTTTAVRSVKKEADDNEPTSTAHKSNNPTPTPEASVQVLDEIVDKMLKPNADRVHILGLLAQILSEEKLELIKSLIENNSRQSEDPPENKEDEEDTNKAENNYDSKTKIKPLIEGVTEEEKGHDEKLAKQTKEYDAGGKQIVAVTKKKRNELDRLNEDIRDMFICKGVLTATGRRMCTIMGQSHNKETELIPQSKSTAQEVSYSNRNKNDKPMKKKEQKSQVDKIKTPVPARPLRRSLRSCRTANEENDDDDNETSSIYSRTTEDSSIDELNTTSENNLTDSKTTPRRKMPILKPNTPIKIFNVEDEEVEQEDENSKKHKNKKKSNNVCSLQTYPTKAMKTGKGEKKNEATATTDEENQEYTSSFIKNTNICWHNQSKFTSWCMICEKKIQVFYCGIHYKIHHGENYVSRLQPILLQQFKQGKLSQPLFGVDKSPRQPTWFYRCPFCLQHLNTNLSLWLEHFQSHTTEFNFQCSKCHYGNNKLATTRRHIKKCGKGASMINSAIQLSTPTLIKAHVCHLCNFIQLRRANLERHYIIQHKLNKNTVELLGYIITLFNTDNVDLVSEDKAAERENEAWESIEKKEQIIDINDDDDDNDDHEEKKDKTKQTEQNMSNAKEGNNVCTNDKGQIQTVAVENTKNFEEETLLNCHQTIVAVTNIQSESPIEAENRQEDKNFEVNETPNTNELSCAKNKSENVKECETIQEEAATTIQSRDIESSDKRINDKSSQNEIINIDDHELVNEKDTAQDLQDELLILAEKAVEIDKAENRFQTTTTESEYQTDDKSVRSQTTMSDIISGSIDMIYNRRSKRKSTENETILVAKKSCPNIISNVFMPTRDDNNASPTIQILAQSIINIEEEAQQKETPLKSISIAERLSQRLRDLQNESIINSQNDNATATTTTPIVTETNTDPKSKENIFEKLINDTVLELEKEKDSIQSTITTATESIINFNNTSEQEKKKETEINSENLTSSKNIITVISDDEDWEDIEITETAPVTTSSTKPANTQKSKNKGLFQKFGGLFKGNNLKSKKNLSTLVYFSKKKSKEKTLPPITITTAAATTSPSPLHTTATTSVAAATKTTATTSTISTNNKSDSPTISYSNNTVQLGFKPVLNIMDDLLPDSPCNDPIDLVPELAPLEPLQDLNDISSILNSNLSVLEASSSSNINVSENHPSIEDALDFISEQQASDNTQNLCTTTSLKTFNNPPLSQGKTIINNISHVGYSVQNNGEFKFYCLLQNCSFLFSNDSIGLETHFMCEHSQMKWNGFCLMCRTPCLYAGEETFSISKEIRHMLDKHVNREINTDSATQHSTTSSQGSDERPKIKLRRLTGDCLSRASLDDTGITLNQNAESSKTPTNTTPTNVATSMLGALLVAKPMPPTKAMPPQPQMPLTEPLLLGNSNYNRETITSSSSSSSAFRNVSNEFRITSVTSAANLEKEIPLKISKVVSLQNSQSVNESQREGTQMPKILDVRTLVAPLAETAVESLEVSQILANAAEPSLQREASSRAMDDSPGPVVVAETVPIAQNKAGDFLITQTVSAQYNDFTSAAVGINISIAPAACASGTTNKEALPVASSIPITSRHYKCMGNGCKFTSRVPVAMSDHLRFHERRNFSNKHDYLDCGFCSYQADDIEDYMKHSNQYHIINKSNGAPSSCTQLSSTSTIDNNTTTTTSLTRKIHNILNNTNGAKQSNIEQQPQQLQQQQQQQQIQTIQVQDTHEDYLEKLRSTIEEIVGPTGLADDKLYRCVIKDCPTQLTETTFLNHIMFHITTTFSNPNSFVFKCPHCTAQYHRAAGIKAHIKNHARNRFFCYLCQDTATNPGQMLKHFSEKHWHTLNMYTHQLIKPKTTSADGSGEILESAYYVVYTQELSEDEVKEFGEKLILEWRRKKFGSKTHFKSSEIDLLPMSAIFQREINCGECEYKTKVRTNIIRHLQMHKQNPGTSSKSDTVTKVCSVDPVNPVPCLNSNERFFDKMTNLASSSLIPSTTASSTSASNSNSSNAKKLAVKIPYKYVPDSKRFSCGCSDCSYLTISEDIFRTHLSTLHSFDNTYRCLFCREEICKRVIVVERIINHLRFHGSTIYRCEECNYVHYLRYVVERHINERHATSIVNIVIHTRSREDNEAADEIKTFPFVGKKYKYSMGQSSNFEAYGIPNNNSSSSSSSNSNKGKGKWICDVCGHKASNVNQIQSHCQQQHGVKNQYKCAHCNFGSQQLLQILRHITENHSGKTREARYMYHKLVNANEESADTRPLWQRNDPTRVRHIRGILMEDEEESEQYRKKLGLTDSDTDDMVDNDGDEDAENSQNADQENNDNGNESDVIKDYEFGCFHCEFKTQIFADLKSLHYERVHNSNEEISKPFWFRMQRLLCCPDCRSFVGNYLEVRKHLYTHNKYQFYAADITCMAKNKDSSQGLTCGYCSFNCMSVDLLYRHTLKMQHLPNDIRIDDDEQLAEMLELGKEENLYQCSLCNDIYPNRVAIVQHACNVHAGESFSFRSLKNACIYRCSFCQFTNSDEKLALTHMIDHYGRFTTCVFCREQQSSFTAYMQHCYAEHRTEIQKFKTIYSIVEIRKYLMQLLVIFRNGLVLNKRNLLNTKYGNLDLIKVVYEEMYKISQQPPIPRLSIARLVARKSIEAQQKQQDTLISTPLQEDHIALMAITQTPPAVLLESKPLAISKRRTTVYYDNPNSVQTTEFNAPLQPKKISKRRCTVAVDCDTLFSPTLRNSTNSLLIDQDFSNKKRKVSHTPSTTNETVYPLNLDMEPFSFYGKKPEAIDLTKVFTKVVIGGINTPLTIDKFKLLFNIECQLKLTKCDEGDDVNKTRMVYNDYKHIKKACPASHKLIYN